VPARALQEQVLAKYRQVLGEDHQETLESMNNLALTLRASRFVGWRRVARATAGLGRHPFP